MENNIDIDSLKKMLKDLEDNIEENLELNKNKIFEVNEIVNRYLIDLKKELQIITEQIKRIINNLEELKKEYERCKKEFFEVAKKIKNKSSVINKILFKTKYNNFMCIYEKIQTYKRIEKKLQDKRKNLEYKYKKANEFIKTTNDLMNRLNMIVKQFNGINKTKEIIGEEDYKNKIIEAQEKERRKLAREIHDGPTQQLGVIIMKTEIINKYIETDISLAKKQIKELNTIARNTLTEIRNILYELQPIDFKNKEFIQILQNYINEIKFKYDLNIDYKVLGYEYKLNNISCNQKCNIFRIIQECLSNIRKHANATYIKLRIEITDDIIHILIVDNGKGFDVNETLNSKKGYGLLGIKERIEMLKGKYSIESQIGKGTKLRFKIPLDSSKKILTA